MDEPFGALDALTKETLQDELSNMIGRYDRATVFITHDIREAVYLADTVMVMSPRPGTILRELKVGFPRPRHRAITHTPEFEEVVHELRGLLQHQTNDPEEPALADVG
jgi:NitT/TauT family transport system ATP-binding protein